MPPDRPGGFAPTAPSASSLAGASLPGTAPAGQAHAPSLASAVRRSRANDYVALAKPRLNLLVVASALAGYVMAGGEAGHIAALVWTMIGTGLVAGGASTFNQVLERERDGRMRRTQSRPLPGGRMSAGDALVFGSALSLAGLLMLAAGVNLLAAGVALATLACYVVIYTPLKPRSSLATVVGAVPGALPPVIGWAAASGTLSHGAWILFGIVFVWQLPHFLAIAWMYRADYERAGFPMLPVIEPDGRSTSRQAVIYTAALLPLALAPTLAGLSGPVYFAGALLLTSALLGISLRFAATRAVTDARWLFVASIAYLPILWVLMIADRV